jgi:hypothetical protein
MDDEWVDTESQIFSLLADAGVSESDEVPRFDVVAAP